MIPSDNELLGKFVRNRDEQSLHEVVYRHSPMVMGVCQSLLWHQEDAEDAFQATFLVLANKANRLLGHSSIAGWLHQVAVRNCRNLRRQRNRKREVELNQEPAVSTNEPWKSISDLHDRELVQQELSRLPTRYREVLLLCYIEGRSRSEAAEILDCTTASVKASLARGRKLLRQRLIRHGIVASSVLGVLAAATTHAKANVPAELLSSTIQLCQGITPKTSFGSSPESIQLLAQKELVGMNFIAYSKLALYAVVGLTLATVPLVLLAQGKTNPQPTVAIGGAGLDGEAAAHTQSSSTSQVRIANSQQTPASNPQEDEQFNGFRPPSNTPDEPDFNDPLMNASADSVEYWRLMLSAAEAKSQSFKEELEMFKAGANTLSQFEIRSNLLENEARMLQITLLLKDLDEKKKTREAYQPPVNQNPATQPQFNSVDPLTNVSQDSIEYWRLIQAATDARVESLRQENFKIESGDSDLDRFAVRAQMLETEAKLLQISLLLEKLKSEQSTPPSNNDSSSNSNPPKFIPPASTATIQPGDVLTIECFNLPEINRNIIVTADQTIVLPLVGTLSVADLDQKQVREKLNDAFKDFVKNPMIDVFRELPRRTGDEIPLGTSNPIEAGELLTVESMTEPAFNRQVTVQADLSITVPMIGVIQAEGLNPEELSKKVNIAAKQLVKDPQILVFRGGALHSVKNSQNED